MLKKSEKKETILKRINLLLILLFTAGVINCGDSLKFRLTKRLNNFRQALPVEIKDRFDKGEYEEAGKMLDEKLAAVKGYVEKFDTDIKKRKFIRADYDGIENDIKNLGIPADLLEFNKKFYKIIDFECIPTFTGPQVIDFFKVYFKEKLASMK